MWVNFVIRFTSAIAPLSQLPDRAATGVFRPWQPPFNLDDLGRLSIFGQDLVTSTPIQQQSGFYAQLLVELRRDFIPAFQLLQRL